MNGKIITLDSISLDFRHVPQALNCLIILNIRERIPLLISGPRNVLLAGRMSVCIFQTDIRMSGHRLIQDSGKLILSVA